MRLFWLRAFLALTVLVGTMGASLAHQPPTLDAKLYYRGPDGLPGVFCLTGDAPAGIAVGQPCDACLLIGAVDLPTLPRVVMRNTGVLAAPFGLTAQNGTGAAPRSPALPRGPPVLA
ncbi:hypothetical protein [Rubricella aquisinus]|uniref:hypothetical protein n=1 Tax=Rubricella aquisinus TaxID=2028108 RepID=UPI001607CF75|nr:hypothetical protein [Rubricella aquisinus]